MKPQRTGPVVYFCAKLSPQWRAEQHGYYGEGSTREEAIEALLRNGVKIRFLCVSDAQPQQEC